MVENGVRLSAVERREQLLESALETFGDHGFTATSMNDIAVVANVTKPVLYQHFDSKHDLFLEVLTSTATQLNNEISAVLAEATSGRKKVEDSIAVYVEFFASNPKNYRVLYGEGVRSEPAFALELRSIQNSINALVADHIEIDELDQDLRRLAAEAISGLMEAAVGRWLDEGQTQSADQVSALLASLAWRGLRNAA